MQFLIIKYLRFFLYVINFFFTFIRGEIKSHGSKFLISPPHNYRSKWKLKHDVESFDFLQ